MLTNEDRANYGTAAIEAGCPDHDEIVTEAADTIANVLHAVAVHPEAGEALIEDVLRRARDYVLDELAGIEA